MSRQVEKFKSYKNPSSTSKAINKTGLNFWINSISISISFEFQVKPGFSGESTTQCIYESCVNVNHMWTYENSSQCHATSCYIKSYQNFDATPNTNPKNECNCHEMSCEPTRSPWHIMSDILACPSTKLLMGFSIQCNNLLNQNNLIP